MKQPIFLGDFEVVEVTALHVRILLGNGVTIYIHPGDFSHQTKLGDRLPLYTELSYAKTDNKVT